MRVGIFAKTFPGCQPEAVLRAVAAAGYASAQWNWACAGLPSMPDEIPEVLCEAVVVASQNHGVAIPAVSGTFNMAHPEKSERAQGLARLKNIIQTAPLIGASMVTLCTGSRDVNDQWARHPENDDDAAWKDFVETLLPAIDIAEAYNVYLGIEPELGNVISSAGRAHRLIKEVVSDRLKIVFDPANLFEVASETERQRIVSEAIDLLAEHMYMAHAKDRNADGTFTTAGKGVLDYSHYLEGLKSAGFDGDLVTHGLSQEDASGVATMLESFIRASPR